MTRLNARDKRSGMLPYLLLLPVLVFAVIFKLYPIFYSFVSGFQFKGAVSLRTYELMFADKTFWNSVSVTVKMNLIMTPLQIILSLIMALMVNANLKGIGVYRSVYYLPVTISMPVAAICFSMILSYNNGVANTILGSFGVPVQGFFNDKTQAMACIIALCTWKGCGYWMMFYLAGLKGIDDSLYEAATVDGAGYFAKLFHVTLPMLRRTTLFVIVADTSTNLLLFAPMKLITDGGPRSTTDVLMYEAYRQAFKYGNYSKGSAITSVLIVIILLVVLLEFRMMADRDR
ncbi:MAG: sugar ABC transporter permease [Clostridia bacterium]|nr:sugar ABC transporter permease [Clostridia bacterium]